MSQGLGIYKYSDMVEGLPGDPSMLVQLKVETGWNLYPL